MGKNKTAHVAIINGYCSVSTYTVHVYLFSTLKAQIWLYTGVTAPSAAQMYVW